MRGTDDDGRGTTERALTLLGLLQGRRTWPGPELAARLGVTPRTVRRDIGRLRALGYPVHAGQGVGGGYRLGPGQELPPLLLDDEEATATAVALLAGAAGGNGEAALRAVTKLARVLPVRLRQEVRALSDAVEFFGADRAPVDPEALVTLAGACRDEVEAAFAYPVRDGGPDGGRRERRVEPHRLVASDRRWYLLAYDLERDDWRTFRVDRMTGVTARTWRFRPRAMPDAAAYVREGVASRVHPHRARFLVHAPAERVRGQVPASAAVVRDRGHGRCEVESGAAGLDRVLLHVLLLGHPFEVLDPPELRDRGRVLARRLREAGTRPPERDVRITPADGTARRDAGGMNADTTTYPTLHTALPIPAETLAELRAADDAGRACVPRTTPEGGEPLRCCLRHAEAGERIALVSYAPLRRWATATGADPGAYDEQGPVFVHAEECGGPRPSETYPFVRPGALRAVRRYDPAGRIVGGRLLHLAEDPSKTLEEAFTEAFEDPQVALVHVRAVEYGCFHFEVRRP